MPELSRLDIDVKALESVFAIACDKLSKSYVMDDETQSRLIIAVLKCYYGTITAEGTPSLSEVLEETIKEFSAIVWAR